MRRKGVQWMLQMRQAFTTRSPTAQVSGLFHCYPEVLWGEHHGESSLCPLSPMSTVQRLTWRTYSSFCLTCLLVSSWVSTVGSLGWRMEG